MFDEGHLLKNVITQIPEFNEDLSKYAVFDEGHLLKNMSSLRYQNLMRISVSMLCLMRDIC